MEYFGEISARFKRGFGAASAYGEASARFRRGFDEIFLYPRTAGSELTEPRFFRELLLHRIKITEIKIFGAKRQTFFSSPSITTTLDCESIFFLRSTYYVMDPLSTFLRTKRVRNRQNDFGTSLKRVTQILNGGNDFETDEKNSKWTKRVRNDA